MAELTLVGARRGDPPIFGGIPNGKPTCAALDWLAIVFLEESPNKLLKGLGEPVFDPEVACDANDDAPNMPVGYLGVPTSLLELGFGPDDAGAKEAKGFGVLSPFVFACGVAGVMLNAGTDEGAPNLIADPGFHVLSAVGVVEPALLKRLLPNGLGES